VVDWAAFVVVMQSSWYKKSRSHDHNHDCWLFFRMLKSLITVYLPKKKVAWKN